MSKEKEGNIIGRRISELRKQRGITQGQMARELNVSLYTVSNWEQGKAFPAVAMIPKVAEYFDVTTDYLLGYDHGGLSKELMHLILRMPDDRKKLAIQFFQNIDEESQRMRELEKKEE